MRHTTFKETSPGKRDHFYFIFSTYTLNIDQLTADYSKNSVVEVTYYSKKFCFDIRGSSLFSSPDGN